MFPSFGSRPRFLWRTLLVVLVVLGSLESTYSVPTASPEGRRATTATQKRDGAAAVEPLPPNHWQLTRSAEEIEQFRAKYNLTVVSATPQDAALMPSWPQALVQYILVAPPVNCASTTTHTTTYTSGGYTSSHSVGNTITPFSVLQVVLSPFVFVAWTVSFGLTQLQRETGGWMSVMGWAAWFDLASTAYGPLALLPLVFQWVASMAIVIQRWHGGVGLVAYQVDDLHGCVPAPDGGLAFLQRGARSHDFRIFQTVTFSVASLFMVFSMDAPEDFNASVALPALAELIFTAVIASRGTPVVVSGNCLLVELNPNRGFLDSSINTRWKVFASFMGF